MTIPGMSGLCHLALRVKDLAKSRGFYERLFGMKVVWQPDPDNVYLSSGRDNLALHQIPKTDLAQYTGLGQYMDHFGMVVESPEAVDRLFGLVKELGVRIKHPPKRHRDGAYSFYLLDPDGNTIQVLYEPGISQVRKG
jgi:catechol 2,3-dioxygenase-like lactoylglutathione lyase family enzyme